MTILNPLCDRELQEIQLPEVMERMSLTMIEGIPEGYHQPFGDMLMVMLADVPDDTTDALLNGLNASDPDTYANIMEAMAMIGAVAVGSFLSRRIKKIAESN